MTFGKKIFTGYIIVVLFAVIIAGAGLSMLQAVDGSYRKFIDTDEEVLKTVLQLRAIITSQGEAYRGFLLYGDNLDRGPWEQANNEFKRAGGKLNELLKKSEDRAILEAANLAANQLYHAQKETIATRDSGDPQKATADARGTVLEQRDALLAQLTKLEDSQYQRLQRERGALSDRVRLIALAMILLSATALLAALIASAVVARSVSRQLRAAIAQLQASTAKVSAMTVEFTASAYKTASAISETTATVTEVKQTATVSSNEAKRVSTRAQLASTVAENGRHAVEDTASETVHARKEMETIAHCVMQLSEQTLAVTDIISTVSDLAEQTNVLSVNTAIEAARAGEHGRGFRVVANEVKSLANQSKQATLQVRSILGETQRAVGAAVMAVEEGAKAVQRMEQKARDAGKSIGSLAESMNLAAESGRQIATSSEQQLVGMDQIAHAMQSISEASAQNMTSARQSEQAVKDLATLAGQIREMIERGRQKER